MNFSALELGILIALASWRISSFLYDEVGPWGLGVWIRERLGIIHDEDGSPVAYPLLSSPMECFWCLSTAISLLLTAITCAIMGIALWKAILLWLSSSTGAIMLERWVLRSKAR